MERAQRLLRLAKLRGDKAAIAILETRIAGMWAQVGRCRPTDYPPYPVYVLTAF